MDRNKRIVKVSLLGIIVNIILVVFKAFIGFITNSIAVILDAVNNLSDALSSVITIIGMKLSSMHPNKKHPYGYGRIEYFSSVIIALIVLLAGLTSFRESFIKIIHPEEASYSIVSLIIIIVAVLVKYFFGQYVQRMGSKLNSNSLIASGVDAVNDSFLSFSTFVAAIISLVWHISLEGYLGIIISLLIIKSAIEILKETINDMIGVRVDSNLSKKIKKTILSFDKVLGVYDLTIHNYGPNSLIASAHIEVDDDLKAQDIHRLTRRIEIEIYNLYGIILTIGIYASNNKDEYGDIKKDVVKLIKKDTNILQMHGFYVDDEYKIISFDLIFNFEELEPLKKVLEIKNILSIKYPEYQFEIIIDTDISD